MKKLILILSMLVPLSANAGLDQLISRSFGGTSKIELQEGERLVNITWKRDELWLLLKNDPKQKPQTYYFKEASVFEILEGTVEIIEK